MISVQAVQIFLMNKTIINKQGLNNAWLGALNHIMFIEMYVLNLAPPSPFSLVPYATIALLNAQFVVKLNLPNVLNAELDII